MSKEQKKCKHEKFERIGEYFGKIYSETKEECKKCGLIREIGENWKNAQDAYNGVRE